MRARTVGDGLDDIVALDDFLANVGFTVSNALSSPRIARRRGAPRLIGRLAGVLATGARGSGDRVVQWTGSSAQRGSKLQPVSTVAFPPFRFVSRINPIPLA